jgi:AcrR family transcriptional regulator
MSEPGIKYKRRARPATAFENDIIIRAATTQILANFGIEGLSFGAVSKESGLSHTAISYRFENNENLLIDLWLEQCVPVFVQELENTLDCLMMKDIDEKLVLKRLSKLFAKLDSNWAALEIIAHSATNRELLKAVSETFSRKINSHKLEVEKAQYTFLWQVLVGSLFHFRVTQINLSKLTALILDIAKAVARTSKPVSLAKVDSSHFKSSRFDTGDETTNNLLQATLECVGTFGFDNTTTNAIAKSAGVTSGALFARFPTKLDLLVTASAFQFRKGYEQNLNFVLKLMEDFGPGIGNAIYLREYLKPGLELERALEIETLRVSWHRRSLHEAIAKSTKEFLTEIGSIEKAPKTADEKLSQMIRVAIPTGSNMLAVVYPDAWEIPFSTVTPSVFGPS